MYYKVQNRNWTIMPAEYTNKLGLKMSTPSMTYTKKQLHLKVINVCENT